MTVTMLKSKIHRATVTEADLNYVGSITIDQNLLDAASIYEYEKVQVVDLNNGNRLETYVIKGERGSGQICLNGAAARLIHPNDMVIIMSYADMDVLEIDNHEPQVVFVNEKNEVVSITNIEEANTRG